MRDPKRIPVIITELQRVWEKYPDWRCGQFMCNILGEFSSDEKIDPFYIEDDRFLEWLKERFE